MIQSAPAGAIGWRQEIASAYAEWTGRMNGLGYAADAEVSRDPNDWNIHYYAFYAERLLDGDDAAFASDLPFVTDLPTRRSAKSRKRCSMPPTRSISTIAAVRRRDRWRCAKSWSAV